MEYAEETLAYLTAIQDGIFQNADSVQQSIPKKSFRKDVYDSGGTLSAAFHMQFLFAGTGSAPGKMRPVEPFYDFIVDRGIQPYPRENKDGSFSAVSQESLAWAMAISQAKEGSAIYQGKKPGVDFESVLKRETPIFLGKIGKKAAALIATTLRSATIIALFFLASCSQKTGVYVKENNKNAMNKDRLTVNYWTMTGFSCLVIAYFLTQPE